MTPHDEQMIDYFCGEVVALERASIVLHIEKNDKNKDARREPFLNIACKLIDAMKEERYKEIWDILKKYHPIPETAEMRT